MPFSILKRKNSGISSFFWLHGGVTLAASLIAYCVINEGRWLNFLVGQFYVWVSLATVTIAVYLFFRKKNIALLVVVIVFKWPILIYVIYKLTESLSLSPVFLALGFSPVLLSALIWSVMQKE